MRPIDGDVLVTIVREGLEQNPHKEGLARVCHRTEYLHFLDVIQRMPTIAPPPNDPLTLKDLREMRLQEWLWIEVLVPAAFRRVESGYYQVFEDYTRGEALCCGWPGTIHEFEYEDYGKTWLVYRRKLEEARDTVPPKTADWAEHFKARFERLE